MNAAFWGNSKGFVTEAWLGSCPHIFTYWCIISVPTDPTGHADTSVGL